MKTVKDFFESHGLAMSETGGGCTAWEREDTDSQYTLVTNGDLSAPQEWSDPCRVSRMVDGEESAFTEYATVSDLRKAVELGFVGEVL